MILYYASYERQWGDQLKLRGNPSLVDSRMKQISWIIEKTKKQKRTTMTTKKEKKKKKNRD